MGIVLVSPAVSVGFREVGGFVGFREVGGSVRFREVGGSAENNLLGRN